MFAYKCQQPVISHSGDHNDASGGFPLTIFMLGLNKQSLNGKSSCLWDNCKLIINRNYGFPPAVDQPWSLKTPQIVVRAWKYAALWWESCNLQCMQGLVGCLLHKEESRLVLASWTWKFRFDLWWNPAFFVLRGPSHLTPAEMQLLWLRLLASVQYSQEMKVLACVAVSCSMSVLLYLSVCKRAILDVWKKKKKVKQSASLTGGKQIPPRQFQHKIVHYVHCECNCISWRQWKTPICPKGETHFIPWITVPKQLWWKSTVLPPLNVMKTKILLIFSDLLQIYQWKYIIYIYIPSNKKKTLYR